ncbi:MAG: DUF11 domain-containing protein, partial [candidate division Zixibacteria bacterium]|nr:DUF11 domain-containing protein [candidate division Zixibacteria bacterium]
VATTVLRERISVVKSVDKTQVTKGDTLTYTVDYTNNSLADLDNVIITDTLAVGLNYVNGSATAGGLYNPINETIVWRIRHLPSGGTGSISFSVEIDESVPNQGAIENFVIFSGDDIPIDTSNLVIVTVTFPEMEISKTVDQVVAIPGDTVTYTINSFNDGAGPLNNAIVIDTLPDDFQYVSGTATVNGTSVAVTGTDILTIPVGTLGAGESAEVIYDLAILSIADRSILHVNSAILSGTNNGGQTEVFGPERATVSLQTPRLSITKTAEVTSSMAGSFVPYKLTITNNANITVGNVIVTDSMPSGLFYVDGSSIIDGAAVADPTGTNPYDWFVGAMMPGQTITLQYMAQLGTSVPPGPAENTAWAQGTVGGESVRTTNVIAVVNVISTNIPGAIRGKIIVDCDGDGISDIDSMLTGIDIYLDDGSNSQVNEKGMFYFGTVRAGEHVVALDIRDLKGYELSEGQDGSVLVYVHEGGESYVTFRVCPAFPKLSITKEAAILPKIRITKTANLSDSMITDSNGVIIDYDILIESGFGTKPGEVVVVDSFPDETQLVIIEDKTKDMSDTGKVLRYMIDSPGEKRLNQSVYYSIDESEFDAEHYLTNNIYLEGVVNVETQRSTPVKSSPVELSVGPFNSVSAGEIEIKMIAAHFITSKAFIQEQDISKIADVADSIIKYSDLDVRVEGFCDYRRIHTKRFPSNWELSIARADSVVYRLIDVHGIDKSRFDSEGFAANHPIDPGHTEASWWQNRRAEVTLSGSIKGGIEFSGDLSQKWSQSTLLELEPTQWDTLIHASDQDNQSEFINTWEVLVTINNIGPGKAGKVVIEDVLPIGAVYEEGSASVNGRKVSAKLDEDNNLTIGSGDIPEGNTVEIRYRIQSDEKSALIGGGKAVVEIEHHDIGVVKQESNPIRFY